MSRFPRLAGFLGEELILVAKAMADGSYWAEPPVPNFPDHSFSEPDHWE